MAVENGSEFSEHERITSKPGVNVYFARQYHLWEWKLNENANGLIKQYFSKKNDFREASDKEVLQVQQHPKNSPRKRREILHLMKYLTLFKLIEK